MDIFSNVGPIFVSPDCKCTALPELIKLCRGKVTKIRSMAKIIIVDRVQVQGNSMDNMNVIASNWILDSISQGKLLKSQLYRLANEEKQQERGNELKMIKCTPNV